MEQGAVSAKETGGGSDGARGLCCYGSLGERLSKIASSSLPNAGLITHYDGLSVGDVREVMRLLADREGWVSSFHFMAGERERLREALGACAQAMETWGSWEDGVPEAGEGEYGSVGKAYDNAKMLLAWPADGKTRPTKGPRP